MRSRSTIWILLCLLCVMGAWLYWRAQQRPAMPHLGRTVSASVSSSSTAPQLVPVAAALTNAVYNKTSSVKTNRFAYRLANTTKSVNQLVHDRHAILLENALIDTTRPLNLSIPPQLQAPEKNGSYIVQWHGPASAAFRKALAQAGATIVSYIPNDAYLVRVPAAGADKLAGQSGVQAVLPYEPYYKIQSSLLGLAVEQKLLPAGAELNLGLFPDAASQTIAQIKKLGGTIVDQSQSPFGPEVRVRPPLNWTALAALPGVQILEGYYPRIHANDLSRATMGVAADTQVPTNYMGLDGHNVLVEVDDSGIDAMHPDLMNRVFGAPANLVDTDGHGTHVAGIIAGDGTKSTTVKNAQGSIMPGVDGQFRGMAPLADLLSMNKDASDRILQETAAQSNALISNNSWGYAGDSSYDLAAASYDAATRDALAMTNGSQPVLFVFAAGNSGGGNNDGGAGFPDTILSPATAKDVITVGALEELRYITNIVTDANSNQSAVWQPETDNSSQVAGFSSRGNVGIGIEGDSGRYKPDVVAPGTFIISDRSGQWATNAYYNPTNSHVTSISDILLPHTQTDPALQFLVFNTAVKVTVTASVITNVYTPAMPLTVEVWQGTDPHTAPPDVTGTTTVTIPPDGTLSPLNTSWQCAVTNTTDENLPYTLTVNVQTTNDLGNYYQVLQQLNDSLGDPGSGYPNGYYRYESGTSMSAAGVSGVLALMQDYFLNHSDWTNPSPALLKALLINGARATGNYDYQVRNAINFEGWGLVSLPNSVPVGLTNDVDTPAASFFVDQSPTNALATGDSHSYTVNVDTNTDAPLLPLEITLAWTDPPGNPAAAIKLVNNLDLVVSNMDTGDTYFGNDIPAGKTVNIAWDTNSVTSTNVIGAADSINNVEQVILPPLLAGHYMVTVIGKDVNANAVTAQTNNTVQDYALVISCGEGEVPDALTVTDNGMASNPTSYQDVTFVTVTNQPLFDQFAGANTPLLGTNTIAVGTNTIWSTNGLITLGMTNQWHFYVVTNTGPTSDYTNAAFITFLPDSLSTPRMGVYANSQANSTRPQADIDMYVSMDPALTNLDPTVIADSDKSLHRGGAEFVTYTNSAPGDVYYVGVKSEDHQGAEYAFIPIFTKIPFGQSNSNGDQIVNGLNVPVEIPDGSPAHPRTAYVFAIQPQEVQIGNVIVTNVITHQNFGDLVGALSHDNGNGLQTTLVLNNHAEPPLAPPGPYTLVYDDSGQNEFPGSQMSDGPGSLRDFDGTEGLGLWILTETDNSQTQTGTVQNLTMLIQPHKDLGKGITVTVQPGSWFYTFIDVSAGFTNLTVFGTNLPPTSVPPLQLYLNVNNRPDFTNYLAEADLTNGVPPGNDVSYGPPLPPGRYWVGVFNPDSVAHDVYLLAKLGGIQEAVPTTDFGTNGIPLLDDAVSSSSLFIDNTQQISSVNIGFVVEHPRISDLTFTLVSPTGKRILLMENRGGLTATNAGHLNVITNFYGSLNAGDANAQTNVIPVPNTGGTLLIDYNFYTIPDTIEVQYDGQTIFGPYTTNNPGNPPQNQTLYIPYGPGFSTNLTIIMNSGGNENTNTAWEYTPTVVYYDYNYLTFTEDTNLTDTPIKFAIPPFDLTDLGTNYSLSDFETNTAGDYFAPTNIGDPYGGWYLPTNSITTTEVLSNFQFIAVTTTNVLTNNQASIVTDPDVAFGGSNFLALANGYMLRTNFMTPERRYMVSYAYRGPGIAGWWRGEGNAGDSADPEGLGQNGSLIGRFNYPAGEVGQAFGFEDAGGNFQFAGTNTYVQIRQSSVLDVGSGGGFTVEGWINPTNVAYQQPLVEWLARVPTNSAVSNVVIEAGPFLDRATDHYYYMLGPTNRTVSEYWAEQLGGHLVTIDTANEQNWVFDNFGNYGGQNHNLWIGLTNTTTPSLTFGWSGGDPVIYTNWLTGQPSNPDGNQNYTFMFGETNAHPALWTLADDNGFLYGSPASNIVYGVVEVDDLQTNGVQFWISVTNQPGTTNGIFDGVGNLYTNGCLYANLVDISNVSHIIYSQPGLVQSNVYQYVALTYDTNSGLAKLYYNGTNVATTNLGVFYPKTGGDVLLGRDMSRETNNYYGGGMDEMSIYNRALSASEIAAIYRVSALTNNRNIGKFDPSITPPEDLATAWVSLGDRTNVILGANNNWQAGGFTFTALTNSMTMQVLGLEPGILFDSFTVSETPLGNLYYLPEQSLDSLQGDSAYGTWTLEIWDNRAGAFLTNSLMSWRLQFILQTNGLQPPLELQPQDPTTISVPPGQTVPLLVNVPTWASSASNILVSASGPVDLLFNPSNPPTGSNPGDVTLLANSTAGRGSPDLDATSSPPLPTAPTNYYYLGVRNTGTHGVSATVEVDFNITTLSNSVPLNGTFNTNETTRYYAFDVSSNAYEATFQLLQVSNNVDLVVRKGPPLPALTSSDYGSFNTTNSDENIYVLTNSTPVPLSAGRWYLGVFKRDPGVMSHYAVLAKELDLSATTPNIIDLTNGVPFNFTAGPGAALTNFFRFAPTNTITPAVTNYIKAIRFELYGLSGNGDLTVQSNLPPFAPPFFESSQNPSRDPELVLIHTNSALTNLATDWYVGVPNHETNLINYTIIAAVETNVYFPAFPGAEGAGGGARGGRIGDVYHVISTDDSGPGTLRDAVSSGNRTVVFDVSGTIFLVTPLIITNSFLTIAGQTAPGDGITVAGQMAAIQSTHDVVVRDVRFRSGGAEGSAFSESFGETNANADFTNGQIVATSTWQVTTNQVSLVVDPLNACSGSNFLALANGVISNALPTVPGNTYELTFAYRGPGIADFWRGENNASDSVDGNGGTAVGGLGYTSGEVGQAFSLNGTSSYVFVPDSPSLDSHYNHLSVEFWCKGNTTGNNANWTWLVTKGNSAWRVMDTQGSDTVTFHISGPGTLSGGSGSRNVNDRQWHHVAATFNGSILDLYVDGTLDGSWTSVGPTQANTQPLEIGHNSEGPGGSIYNGLMDEVSLYNRALSPSEVKAIYQNGHAGKFDSNVSFPQNLAEAQISVNGQTPVTFYGDNTNWNTKTITFTATQSNTPIQIFGIEPGMLLSSVTVEPVDALEINTVSNFIADHVTATWSTNDDLSLSDSTNVTVQWSIISDGIHDTNTMRGYGSSLRNGGGTLTFHHNLYADDYNASPQFGDNINLDFVNNVIYNWGTNASSSLSDAGSPGTFTNRLNYIGNYLIVGTNFLGRGTSLTNIAFWGGSTNTWIFQTNNFIDSNTNGILDGADTGWGMFTNKYAKFDRPFPTVLPVVDEAFLAYEKVLDFAGPSMDKRDLADSNIVENVRTQTGRILDSIGTLPVLNSVYPYLDTDQDGIPDFWEITLGEPRFTPSATQDRNGDGYTDLEEYNNWLAGPHALTITNTPVGVDLQQLFGRTGNLSFMVTNAVQGFVYLTNVLDYTNVAGTVFAETNTDTFSNIFAVFTPTNNQPSTTNYSGYAAFDVYVTNNDTIAYFGPVTVSVMVSALPVKIDSNMPPVITTLTSGEFDPTNSGGTQYYEYTATPYAAAVLFAVTNISVPGGLDSVVKYQQPLPSLSRYDYINTNSVNGYEYILVTTNSFPQPMTNGNWYLGVVNVNPTGDPVSYDVTITELASVYPPKSTYPTNNVFTNIETTPFTLQCQGLDTNTPPLPLTYSIVTNVWPTNLLNEPDTNLMTIDPDTGIINWTPDEAQGPFTNFVAVKISNGYAAVTNSFTVIVEESNLPPFWTTNIVTNYVIYAQSQLSMVDTATDTDIPVNPLTYSLLTASDATNALIDTNGIITWAPTAAQTGMYVFTNIVTDTNQWAVNAQSLSNTNYIFITVLPSLVATNGLPETNVVGAGGIDWITVNVPTNADWATNSLLFATNLPVNIWFSTNAPPSITNTGDLVLLPGVTNGVSILGTNTAPDIVPGGTYYLGVQNTNTVDVEYALEVDFHLLTNSIPPVTVLLNGTGDLRGVGVKYLGGHIYIVGDDSSAGGLIGAYATPLATNSMPVWQTNWPSANPNDLLYGITADGNGVYAAGPDNTRTTDTVGGKENKGLVVKYPLDGATGSGFGGDVWDVQTPAPPGAFSYGGYEALNAVTLASESGTNYVYATGNSQEDGSNGGRLYVSKLAEDSTILWTKNDGTGGFGEPYSAGNAIVSLGGYVYAAGQLNGSPYLRKYDSSGNLVWSHTTSTNGAYYGVCTYANFIFTVGGVGSGSSEDFLVDKWDDSGNRIWSRTYDHGGNQDRFNSVVVGNGHLFCVGATYGLTAGGADAIVSEISPATGNWISTNLFGGTLDDKANGVDTDNTNLYVIGESKSYTPGTNQLMLVEYPLPLPSLTNGISGFHITIVSGPAALLQWSAPTNYQFQVQWTTSLSSPIVWNTFTNIVSSPTGTFNFTDDGSLSGGFSTAKFYRLVEYPNP